MDPEYVTGQINSRILELLLIILLFDFCTVSKILICFRMIKRFPTDYKRYSSHLQVLILHRVAPIKVYLTKFMRTLKTVILKKFSYHK